MYSPYSPVSGAFTSLPENAFVTPSYFLISSPTKFISSPQWVYLRESKLNAHKFASLGASNLKLKASKTTERNETLKTSKLLKKLSLLFFRLNLNFLLDHRGTGKQLKSLKKSSEFWNHPLSHVNYLTHRFIKRFKKSPYAAIHSMKLTKYDLRSPRFKLSRHLLNLLKSELVKVGVAANEHLIASRLNKLIYKKLIKLQPARRKFALEGFKQRSKRLLAKSRLIQFKRSKINYRFSLNRVELKFSNQLRYALTESGPWNTHPRPLRKKALSRKRTSFFWRHSFNRIRKKMKKLSSRTYLHDRSLSTKFFESFLSPERFSPPFISRSSKSNNFRINKRKSFTFLTPYKGRTKKTISNFFIKKFLKLNLRNAKTYSLFPRIFSGTRLKTRYQLTKFREAVNSKRFLRSSRTVQPLLQLVTTKDKYHQHSNLISDFTLQSLTTSKNLLAMEKAASPSFTNWRQPKQDYSFWLKRIFKLPRKKRNMRRLKRLRLKASRLIRLRYSLSRRILTRSFRYLNPLKFNKTNPLKPMLPFSESVGSSQTPYTFTLNSTSQPSFNHTYHSYRSFLQTTNTLKLRRRRKLKPFIPKNIHKKTILTKFHNSTLRQSKSKPVAKDMKTPLLRVSNSSYLHSYYTRNWLRKFSNSRLTSLNNYTRLIDNVFTYFSIDYVGKVNWNQPKTSHSGILIDNNPYNNVYSKLFSTKKLVGDVFFFSHIASNPLVLKYLMYKTTSLFREKTPTVTSLRSSLITQLLKDSQTFMFGDRRLPNKYNNVQPTFNLKVSFKRRVIYNLIQKTFMVNIVLLKYKMLIEAMEHFSGRKIYLKLSPSLEKSLTFGDNAQCRIWESRIYGFRRMLGPRIFVVEALRLVCLSLRLKDPTFLANWIRGMLKRLSFWKHRLIFRYLRYLIRYLFMNYFPQLGFRGIKVQLKGKISVAGNARTRTLFFAYGETSQSTFDHKVAYDLSFVETFTGVMGFKLWFFY